MDKWQHKAFRIIRVRPYSCENGCIVYVDVPDGIWNAAEPDETEDLSSGFDCRWEEILDRCQLVRGSIYPVIVLSAGGRKLLRIRGLKVQRRKLRVPESRGKRNHSAILGKIANGHYFIFSH